ncbi:uncharacterized protein LAJ45_04135 [Morchella importuna]|uniref:uncharacterized protein n=1 Tax=Morchella importuna TaxID=1174673 RepID=UPI001E8D330D|nr:uncharacterized protein LAJ45_04135 [Morchella importuna]KAH8151514.1 hypothetical protein LAJ45_04135 [Morchella importuna]
MSLMGRPNKFPAWVFLGTTNASRTTNRCPSSSLLFLPFPPPVPHLLPFLSSARIKNVSRIDGEARTRLEKLEQTVKNIKLYLQASKLQQWTMWEFVGLVLQVVGEGKLANVRAVQLFTARAREVNRGLAAG